MDDKELERRAVQELLGEAKRGKDRSETMGTYGWQKRSVTTNKRFLRNTLLGTLPRKQKTTATNKNKVRAVTEPAHECGKRKPEVSHLEHYQEKKVCKPHSLESSKNSSSAQRTVGASSRTREDRHSKVTDEKTVRSQVVCTETKSDLDHSKIK